MVIKTEEDLQRASALINRLNAENDARKASVEVAEAVTQDSPTELLKKVPTSAH